MSHCPAGFPKKGRGERALIEEFLIAPCGFNCRVCAQYQKVKDACPGCLLRSTKKSRICILKNCHKESRRDPVRCTGCTALPCARLRQFDARYQERTRGYLSVIQNLRLLEEKGMEAFLVMEEEKWHCPQCGAWLCVSSHMCTACGYVYREPWEKNKGGKK